MSNPKKGAKGLYTLTVTVEEGGKKVRKYFRGKTMAEARRKMVAYQTDAADKAKTGRTFKEVAEEWKDSHWSEIKPGTQVSYRPALKRALEAFGGAPVRQITPLDVQRSIHQMAKQGYAQHSVEVYKSVIKQIFDHAVLKSDIDINPTVVVKVPKGLAKTQRTCPEDRALEIINENINHPFGLFPFMLRYTGLRRGELLALQWQDLDFKQHRISITKSVSYATGNKPIITSPKTEAGKRKIIMVNKIADALEPIKGKPEAYLFGGAAPLTDNMFQSRWRRYCLESGLWKWKEVTRDGKDRKKVTVLIRVPAVTPHQLRHAYATMCFDLGIDPKDTQKQLGHRKLETTMDTYTHIREARDLEVERKLNQA